MGNNLRQPGNLRLILPFSRIAPFHDNIQPRLSFPLTPNPQRLTGIRKGERDMGQGDDDRNFQF